MKKHSSKLAILLAAGIALSCGAFAQTSTPQSTAPAKTSATAQEPAAKTVPHKASKAAAQKPAGATEKKEAAKTPAPLALDTQKAKQSYAIGNNIGKTLQRDGIEVDPNVLMQGIKDVLSGNKLLLTEDEAKAVFATLQADAKAKHEAEAKAAADTNAKDGAAFLAANKSKEGVVTLPSGLQYKVEKQGDGPKPTTSDTVVCNYRGTLVNGKEFDSSYKRGQPATFPVTGVIKGWTEILQTMPVGSKYQVYIPADLAYGDHGPGEIGPNATLIFEIELLSIKQKPADAKAPAAPAAPAPAASAAK